MKNKDQWRPTKFVYRKGRLAGSRDSKNLGVTSWLAGDLIAAQYDEHLRNFATGKLIDLGCGKVPFYEAYRRHVSDIICVDWANGQKDNPFLDLECDLNEPLPFSSEEFNTILLSDVLEHIAQPKELWLEMGRILKPGGTLIMNVPFLYNLHALPYDYFRYTEFALVRFASTAGFRIEVLKNLGGIPEVVTILSLKLLVRIPWIGGLLASLAHGCCKLFLKLPVGKRISEKTGRTSPFGYFLVARKM